MSHISPGPDFQANSSKLSGISLEQVELEMVLNMQAGEQSGFIAALRSATSECNSDYLFDFPAERFPYPCEAVACVQLNTPGYPQFCYVYQESDSSAFNFACVDELKPEFHDFARSYVSVMEQLRQVISADLDSAEKH